VIGVSEPRSTFEAGVAAEQEGGQEVPEMLFATQRSF